MDTELKMLVLSGLLTLGLALISAVPLILTGGLRYGAGNREEPITLPKWGDRTVRAYRNMLDNLAPFAVLVLAAQAAGVSNEATAAGAVTFFAARVAHATIYIAGIPYLRTVAFIVAFGGMIDIARELFAVWTIGTPA